MSIFNSYTISLVELMIAGLTSCITAYVVSPLVIGWYKKNNWLDDPKNQVHPKVIHSNPTPRGGGIVIFTGLLVGSLLFVSITPQVIYILVGALLLTLAGVFDDRYDVNPYLRLLIGFVAAGLVTFSGTSIEFITNPFGEGVLYLDQLGWLLMNIVAMLWIVWNMNMINWSKGLDGQLPGIVVVAALVIMILSLRFKHDASQWPVTFLACITAGAYLGFLPWNFYPQKMMPGYGAGSLAGYMLSVLSILSGSKLATLILVLGIPMIDAGYVVVRRIKNGKSPVWGDRTHFHHMLLDLGWSKPRIAIFYWIISLILGFIALQLNARQKIFTIVLLILLFGALITWLQSLITSLKPQDQDNG